MSRVIESCVHVIESCHMWPNHVTRGWVMSHVNESWHNQGVCTHAATQGPEGKVMPCVIESRHMLSRVIESCHMWLSHVTCDWGMSRVIESCHVFLSHVTCDWVMSNVIESCHMWPNHVTRGWVMSPVTGSCHTWLSHVTCEWAMARSGCVHTLSHAKWARSWIRRTQFMCVCIYINVHKYVFVYIQLYAICLYTCTLCTDTYTLCVHTIFCMFIHVHIHMYVYYGVATISRLLKIIGLLCRIWSLL